ncbi:MAG: penicillin-binding protein [Myxococcales bacterium]|nr:penicillin-binding protein [Myxococcales bacterium]
MRQGFAMFAAVALVAATLPFLRKHDEKLVAVFGDLKIAASKVALPEHGSEPQVPPLTGIDLANVDERGTVLRASAHGKRTAELTLDPLYQEAAGALLRAASPHEAAVVMTEVATGRVLAWASVNAGRRRDVCVEAKAPSASVFKIVTGTALVEQGVPLSAKHCYHGGEHGIGLRELEPDEGRDKYCASLGMAMGRSLNTVFARLAKKHVVPEVLKTTAQRLGWGTEVPFDVEVAPSTLELPEDELEYARTAAGFWHSTMSPFQGANLALTVASGGQMIRQHIVERVLEESGEAIYERPKERQVLKRAIDERTASAVARMMEHTVRDGTSFQSFHDRSGRPFLPDTRVAGKTGTLNEKKTDTLYTWWVGFAPAQSPEVALSVLVANRGTWHAKATHVAADMLRVYFADRGREGVRAPPGLRTRPRANTSDTHATGNEKAETAPAAGG